MDTNNCSEAYKKYLLSPSWQQDIRPSVLERDGYKCQMCGAVDSFDNETEMQVHHVVGKYRFHEKGHENTLIVLCPECHQKYHEYMKARDWLNENKDTPFRVRWHTEYQKIVENNQAFIDRYFRICKQRGCFD